MKKTKPAKVHMTRPMEAISGRPLCNMMRGVYSALPETNDAAEVTCVKCLNLLRGLPATGRKKDRPCR